MAESITLQVSEQDRDRYTRVASIELNKKKVRTPCFVTQIQNKYEFDIFFNLKAKYEPNQLDGFVVKYPRVPSVLRRIQPNVKYDVLGNIREDKYTLFMRHNLFLIDPATDSLFYEGDLDSFALNHNTPQCIIDYTSKLHMEKKDKTSKVSYSKRKEKLHKNFWKERVSNDSEKLNFVKKILDFQHQSGADILLPPAPLIDSAEMLDIAIEINNAAKGIARIYRKQCATYLNVKSTLLKSDELLDKIKLAVYENSSKNLTVFKFKNLDLSLPRADIPRENYRRLMLDLTYFSQEHKNRACMVLENSHQCLVSPFAGFDIVSSSFTLYDNSGGYSKHPPYGSYFDPNKKIHISFDDLAKGYKKLGRLRCNCESCKDVSVGDLTQLKSSEWNVIRRLHIPLFMNKWMEYIKRAVKERNTELARDSFSNSKISNLKDVLP